VHIAPASIASFIRRIPCLEGIRLGCQCSKRDDPYLRQSAGSRTRRAVPLALAACLHLNPGDSFTFQATCREVASS